MMNCTKGTIDDSNFGKPMPIIGLFVAGATSLCIIAMVIDLVKGIKSKQYWIPPKYFSVDAASLTIIGVAIKLSVDLNSPMPSKIDQLAKLATSAFICTVLVNIVPSLGKSKKGELLANRIGLAILIITSIVSLCLQLKTGAIHAFRGAHVFMIVAMSYFLYLCHNLVSLYLLQRNHILEKFEKLDQQALNELRDGCNERKKDSKKMEEYLMKFSMMAQSGCPQLVLSRSYPSVALAQYILLPASALSFVLFATITTHEDEKIVGLNTCSGESDYGWSVLLILVTQAMAVLLGLVIPLYRVIYVLKAYSPLTRDARKRRKEESLPESNDFWMKFVDRTKLLPIFPYIEHRYKSPIVFAMKVTLSLLHRKFHFSYAYCCPVLWPLWVTSQRSHRERSDLRPYFLNTSREDSYTFLDWEYIVDSISHVTHKYISDGKKEEPKRLIDFLKDNMSYDFGGVLSFESDQVSIPDVEQPPNCWALPVLTLTCIATSLPNIDPTSKEQLRMWVNEGLVYVKLVEDNLNATHDHLCNIQYAAHMVWTHLNRPIHRWLSVDLDNVARNNKSPTEVLSWLAESAKEMFHDYRASSDKYYRLICGCCWCYTESGRINCCKAVAAHSMYKICQTALQDWQNEDNLFEKLIKTIADIMGACFTNLRQCILLKCKTSTIENRRETALRMLQVFGETKKIMDILEEKAMKIPLSDDKLAFIDEWRLYLKHQRDIV